VAAYRVEIQAGAKRDLDKLSPGLLQRVAERVEALAADPRARGAETLAGLDAYRIRVGDYRVIYEVNDRGRAVIVTRVRHRRKIYRKLR